MSGISEEEIERRLKNLGQLEEVPEGVSKRFEETLLKLSSEAPAVRKSSWLTSSNWAVAAGFALVFSLGAFIFGNSNSSISQNSSTNTSVSSKDNNSEVLVSGGNAPQNTNAKVPVFYSSTDYSGKVFVSNLPFKPTNNFGAITELEESLKSCIRELGLEENVSLIDRAFFESKSAIAIWSALEERAWQVFVIDKNCSGLTEVLVDDTP